MKTILTLLIITAWGFLTAQEATAKQYDAMLEESIGLEFDGLILDLTRTRAGREFYEYFYAKWLPPATGSGFDILLEELPARGLFGFLEIKVNDVVVAAYNLQPGQEWMETTTQQAVERVAGYFQNLNQVQRDLESKDQAGSGIY